MKLLDEWRAAVKALADETGSSEAEQAAFDRWSDYAHDRHLCYDCGKPAAEFWNWCDQHMEPWMVQAEQDGVK